MQSTVKLPIDFISRWVRPCAYLFRSALLMMYDSEMFASRSPAVAQIPSPINGLSQPVGRDHQSVHLARRTTLASRLLLGLLMLASLSLSSPLSARAQDTNEPEVAAPATEASAPQAAPDAAATQDAASSETADESTAGGESGESTETTPTEAEAGDAETEVAAEAPKRKELPIWYQNIDSAFGKYVLDPLVFVLFNSLGTEYLFGRKIPLVVIWLLVGATFLTIRMGLVNVRLFWHAIRLTKGDYDDKSDPGEVSHFQALASALSATVGLGNIAGVAIAVGSGGPGAIFWMILIGLLGMTSKFTECTLGQLYRRVNEDGTVSGGAFIYLKKGLQEMGLGALGSVLAIIFSILCICASFGGGNAFQVGQSLDAIQADVKIFDGDHYPILYGILMAIVAGAVIIGGIKSIGRVASLIVPFMCIAYVSMALYILVTNYTEVPRAVGLIFQNAWSMQAGIGGLLGVMVLGIQRAVFSNEAGTGSAAIAHSAAKTDEPVSEGVVALLEPFIDTVLVCTMTGLVIVIAGGEWVPNKELATVRVGDVVAVVRADGKEEEKTLTASDISGMPLGAWTNPEYFRILSDPNQPGGSSLTAAALTGDKGLKFFKWILYASVVLFAFSTIISWSYYGERCWTNLFGPRSSIIYKIVFLGFTVLGSVVTKGKILEFSDALILGMSFPNILGMYLLSGKVRRELNRYSQRLKSGEIKPNS